MNQGIVWLASYPKSGNTWFRIFLTHILHPQKPFKTIIGTGAAARFLIDNALGFDSRLLDDKQIAHLRPHIYEWHARQPGVKYFKIHDAYHAVNNMPLVPKNSALSIIYFIRNPLDVVISFAHHMDCSIDQAINMMNNRALTLSGFAANPMSQVPQLCSTWSSHVKSWTAIKEIELLVIRYEDMHANTIATFTKALKFLQIKASHAAILAAITQSQYQKLREHEQKYGFTESAGQGKSFFRKGIVGDWKNTLNALQIKTVISHHNAVMRQFGYLVGSEIFI